MSRGRAAVDRDRVRGLRSVTLVERLVTLVFAGQLRIGVVHVVVSLFLVVRFGLDSSKSSVGSFCVW